MKVPVKFFSRIAARLVAGIFCLLAVAPLSSESSDEKKVRIGFLESPFFISDVNGNVSGYAYDYFQDISIYTGWKYEYVYGSWNELITLMEDGKLDILADVSKTTERREKMLFSQLPMGIENYFIFTSGNNFEIDGSDLSTLNGKKIGISKKSIIGKIFPYWCKKNKIECEVVECNGYHELTALLKERKLDAIVEIDNLEWENINAVAKVASTDFYFAINKDRPDLKVLLDDAMERIFRTNLYYNQELYRKYLTYTANAALSSEEINWLSQQNRIRIGYVNNQLAFCGKNKNTGDLEGALATYIKEASCCFSNYPFFFEAVCFDDHNEMIEALCNDEIDCCFPILWERYFAEKLGVNVSNPFINSSVSAAFVKKNFNEYESNIVAVKDDDINKIKFIELNYPNWVILMVSSDSECERAVLSGKADVLVLSTYQMDRKVDRTKFSFSVLTKELQMGIAVKRGGTELLSIINHSIALIPESTINNSLAVYSISDRKTSFEDFISDNWVMVLVIILIVGVSLLVVFMLYHKSLIAEQQARHLNSELELNLKKLNENYNVVQSIGLTYTALYYIDIQNNTFVMINSVNKEIRDIIGNNGYAQEKLDFMCENLVDQEENVKELKAFLNISTLNKRLADRKYLSIQFKGVYKGWMEGYMIVVDRDENNDVHHVLWAMRDINEQKVLELSQSDALKKAVANAESANRAKTVFLNSMSHDIRTPMNAIIGFTSLASNHLDDKELLSDYLNKINISSNHLLSLINDVLDMSRIESGKVKLEDKVVHLPDVIDDLVTITTTEVEKKGIKLNVATNVNNENIFCDRLRLNQILLNLISNAMKYSNAGGTVSLSISENKSLRKGYGIYEFHVKDDGIGMSSKFLKHIFEPFERERTATVSGIQGSGLGLSITKNIVDMMGGKISVNSKANEGTEVIVTISFKICTEPLESQAESVKKKRKSFKGKKILLVEDNDLNQEIAVEILKESGFVVDVANDGDVAVEIMRKARPGKYDLILMDIQMPKMDGYTATREIRTLTNSQVAGIPIIAMTANAFDEDKQKSIKAGMNAHVAKPINVDILLDTISEYL